MFEQIGDLTLAQVTVGFAAILAFVAGLWSVMQRVRRIWNDSFQPFWHNVEAGLIVLNGRDPITLPENSDVEVSPAIRGAAERLAAIEETCSALKAEVTANGGESLKDVVKKIDQTVSYDSQRLDQIEVRLQNIEEAS